VFKRIMTSNLMEFYWHIQKLQIHYNFKKCHYRLFKVCYHLLSIPETLRKRVFDLKIKEKREKPKQKCFVNKTFSLDWILISVGKGCAHAALETSRKFIEKENTNLINKYYDCSLQIRYCALKTFFSVWVRILNNIKLPHSKRNRSFFPILKYDDNLKDFH